VKRASWRHLFAIAAAAGIVLPPAALRGQPLAQHAHRRVVLVVDTAGDALMLRIRAEVASLGLEVVVRPRQGPIETAARAEGAVAAIRALPSRNGVEVWMADETSGRSLLRQAIVDETKGGPNQHLIALQTAELLRTSLFPHPPPGPPKPSSAPAPPPSVIIQVAPAAGRETALSSGFGLLYGAGGAGPALQAYISLEHLWSRRLGMALAVSAPVHRGTMSGREGSADVGAILAGAEVIARFASERRPVFLTTGLGAAFASVLATGHPIPEATAQLMSNSSSAYTAVGYARATLGWKVSSWLTFGMSALAGTTVTRVHIRFAGSDAGDWGVPILGAALSAQVEWN
jgi:hypothetical protein